MNKVSESGGVRCHPNSKAGAEGIRDSVDDDAYS